MELLLATPSIIWEPVTATILENAMPAVARYQGVKVDNVVYVMGGVDGNKARLSGAINTIVKFDLDTNTSTTLSTVMPSYYFQGSATITNDGMVYLGGIFDHPGFGNDFLSI